MKIKIKHILAGLIMVILIFGITYIYINRSSIEEDINNTVEETIKNSIWNYEDKGDIIVYELAKKNVDWSQYPLTEEFKKQYNEKDGILGDIQYDKIEYKPFNDGEYYFTDYSYLVVTQGKKKTAYVYSLYADNGLISKVNFFNICELTDENGDRVDDRQRIKEDNFKTLFYELTLGGEDEKGVAVTPSFHKKYSCFLDLFIHYSPLGSNEITFDYGKSSFEDKIAYFTVDSIFECKKREYEVKFFLDDNGYLDDAEVELISEKSYEKNKKDKAGAAVFYKNSNWEYLKLTDNFINKYKEKGTFFNDIEKVYISIPAITSIKCNNNWIGQYKYRDGSNHWFYENYIYDDNGYLDDAYFVSIDYNGNSGEEAKEIYLKNIEKDK